MRANVLFGGILFALGLLAGAVATRVFVIPEVPPAEPSSDYASLRKEISGLQSHMSDSRDVLQRELADLHSSLRALLSARIEGATDHQPASGLDRRATVEAARAALAAAEAALVPEDYRERFPRLGKPSPQDWGSIVNVTRKLHEDDAATYTAFRIEQDLKMVTDQLPEDIRDQASDGLRRIFRDYYDAELNFMFGARSEWEGKGLSSGEIGERHAKYLEHFNHALSQRDARIRDLLMSADPDWYKTIARLNLFLPP